MEPDANPKGSSFVVCGDSIDSLGNYKPTPHPAILAPDPENKKPRAVEPEVRVALPMPKRACTRALRQLVDFDEGDAGHLRGVGAGRQHHDQDWTRHRPGASE